jgi:hypothetical protein
VSVGIAVSVGERIGTSGDATSSGVGGVGTGVTPVGGVNVAVTVTVAVTAADTAGVGGVSNGGIGTAVSATADRVGATLADGVVADGWAYATNVIHSEPAPPAMAASSAMLTAAHRMGHPTLVPMAPTP